MVIHRLPLVLILPLLGCGCVCLASQTEQYLAMFLFKLEINCQRKPCTKRPGVGVGSVLKTNLLLDYLQGHVARGPNIGQ